MKKFLLFFVLILVVFLFSSCSKQSEIEYSQKDYLNLAVAEKIETIENFENFDDETIKSISVIIRTNLLNSNESYKKEEYSIKNNHIYNLSKETDGEILNCDKNNQINISFNQEEVWERKIKKSNILKFLKDKNINITNISSIEPNYNNSGSFESLTIEKKNIPFNELKENFDIPSNNITNISSNIKEITISGKYIFDNNNTFFIKQNLKKLSYKELLKENLPNYKLKTI